MYHVDFVEFPSESAAVSGRFFQDAFGWAPTRYGPTYVDMADAGIGMGVQEDAEERTAAPLVVVRAEDLAAARAAVEAAGGVVTTEPFDFPGGRRFHFREPGGNELAVWQPAD